MSYFYFVFFFFFFKQKTAYEMRISDWSSDVCSSDLPPLRGRAGAGVPAGRRQPDPLFAAGGRGAIGQISGRRDARRRPLLALPQDGGTAGGDGRSEEHTSELQSLMRISYAVFCLKKKQKKKQQTRYFSKTRST